MRFSDWLNQTLLYCCATLRSISFRIQLNFRKFFFVFKYVFYVSKSHACFESEWYNSLGRLQLYLIWLNDYFQVFIFEHTHFIHTYFSLQRLRVTQPHHFRQKNVEKNVKINRLIFDLIRRKFHFKLIDMYNSITLKYFEIVLHFLYNFSKL